ncbi:YjcB family protein [Rouxiella sp. T17]|uniref:YjcB family protein n=1 Tax=Rouxiella sp. T17 TaxID=3085684 RepID=UPI002FC91A8F
MNTLTTGFMMMRWELLSALMMFFASQLNVVCRQTSKNALAFMCSGLGLSMTCWFVMGLMGMSLSVEAVTHFWLASKDVFIDIMSQTPTTWPMP